MYMCNIPETTTISTTNTSPYTLALDILLPLGEYFQIQDDFLDYSADPEQLGKVGTDIIDNKCSWCINTALAVATPEQRKVLDENYGKKDGEKEDRVKALYEEIGIPARYSKYEEAAYKRISEMISLIPEVDFKPTSPTEPATLRRLVFTTFLEKIYKRTK